MPIKDPTTWSMGTWALAVGMAFTGGFINWYTKVRQGHTRGFNIVELVGEIMISGFVGLAVFMLLASYDQPMGLCAAASGVSGHMGTRLLFLVEQFISHRVSAEIDKRKP
ncbi:MAG: phage holin family protein [Proteobacteria bacterium]|nr:phage holin family protein [Pseudomonadota bacterium]